MCRSKVQINFNPGKYSKYLTPFRVNVGRRLFTNKVFYGEVRRRTFRSIFHQFLFFALVSITIRKQLTADIVVPILLGNFDVFRDGP